MQFTEHFSSHEFDSPDLPDSGLKMNKIFVGKLQKLRYAVGKPLIITSGYRTKAHNLKIAGTKNSSHLKGLAADIKVNNLSQRFALLCAACEIGFNRIGIGNNFIHLDDDKSKAQGVCWLYKS